MLAVGNIHVQIKKNNAEVNMLLLCHLAPEKNGVPVSCAVLADFPQEISVFLSMPHATSLPFFYGNLEKSDCNSKVVYYGKKCSWSLLCGSGNNWFMILFALLTLQRQFSGLSLEVSLQLYFCNRSGMRASSSVLQKGSQGRRGGTKKSHWYW